MLILLVVYGHCLYWLDGSNNTSVYYFIPKIIYTFHMPLFIFLSGYFFASKATGSFYQTTTEKFKRLIIPHLFFNIIMIIPIFLFWEQYGHFITREMPSGTISLKSIYHYFTMFWYLWCVFFSCIITNCTCILMKRHANITLIGIALLLLFLSKNPPTLVFFEHQQMGRMFFYFVLGKILYNKISLFTRLPIVICSTFIYLLYILCIEVFQYDNTYITEIGNMVGLICAFNFFLFLYKHNIFTRYLCNISKYTLGIYIYHFVILYTIMAWFNTHITISGLSLSFLHIITAIVTIALVKAFISLLKHSDFFRIYALGEKQSGKNQISTS